LIYWLLVSAIGPGMANTSVSPLKKPHRSISIQYTSKQITTKYSALKGALTSNCNM